MEFLNNLRHVANTAKINLAKAESDKIRNEEMSRLEKAKIAQDQFESDVTACVEKLRNSSLIEELQGYLLRESETHGTLPAAWTIDCRTNIQESFLDIFGRGLTRLSQELITAIIYVVNCADELDGISIDFGYFQTFDGKIFTASEDERIPVFASFVISYRG